MKPRPRDLLKALRRELKNAPPKSRDRLRQKVRVFETVVTLRKKPRAA